MHVLNDLETTQVNGAAYGAEDTYCPPGYVKAVTTSSTTSIVEPNATGTIGMNGPVPSGSATLSAGTTTTTYTVNTTCLVDMSDSWNAVMAQWTAYNGGVMAKTGLSKEELIYAF